MAVADLEMQVEGDDRMMQVGEAEEEEVAEEAEGEEAEEVALICQGCSHLLQILFLHPLLLDFRSFYTRSSASLAMASSLIAGTVANFYLILDSGMAC